MLGDRLELGFSIVKTMIRYHSVLIVKCMISAHTALVVKAMTGSHTALVAQSLLYALTLS